MNLWLARSLKLVAAALFIVFVAGFIAVVIMLETPLDREAATANVLWLVAFGAGIISLGVVIKLKGRRDLQAAMIVAAAIPIFAAGLFQQEVTRIARERKSNIWWQEPSVIEQFLLQQTPVGTPEPRVVSWLEGQAHALGRDPNIVIRRLSTTEVDGVVSVYPGVVFQVWVSAVYTFDATHRLVSIRVTKRADAI
jgi:hypothetical protein